MTRSVSEITAQFFASQGPVKSLSKGEVLLFAHEDPTSITFLLTGMVEQYDITPDGTKVIVNTFKPSAFFPMSWALNSTPNSYFFAAATPITYHQAPAEVVLSFLREHPEVTLDLLSRVYRGTDGLLQRLVLASNGLATQRLMFELLVEARRFGEEANKSRTLLTVKQAQLAARSGLARETVSRELHKLSDQGVLEITKAGIAVDSIELKRRLELTT